MKQRSGLYFRIQSGEFPYVLFWSKNSTKTLLLEGHRENEEDRISFDIATNRKPEEERYGFIKTYKEIGDLFYELDKE